MHVVDAAPGRILAQLMDHVADIVQQRGQHGGGRRAVGLGQRRRLQRMLELVDLAQAVAARGAADEDVQEFLAQGIAHAPFLARTARIAGNHRQRMFQGIGPPGACNKIAMHVEPPHGTKAIVAGH